MSRRCACCDRFSADGSASAPIGKLMCLSYGCRVLLVDAPELRVQLGLLMGELHRSLEECLGGDGEELDDARCPVPVHRGRPTGCQLGAEGFVTLREHPAPRCRV